MISLLIIAISLAGLGAEGAFPREFVTTENSPHVTVTPGKPGKAELKFRVQDGFHVNSNMPHSTYLIPTKLTLSTPTGIMVSKITYPPGTDMSFPFSPDEKLNVYSGEFTVTAGLSAARNAAPGQHKLSGELSYQACNDRACYPPKKLPVSIDITVLKPKV